MSYSLCIYDDMMLFSAFSVLDDMIYKFLLIIVIFLRKQDIGVISVAAAFAAEQMVPGVKEYLIASHQSREPAAELMMQKLGLKPVLYANLALGEGTGAVLMFSLLDTVGALYENKTTFSDIKVEQYTRF